MSGARVRAWALRTPVGATVDDVVARLLAGERVVGPLARVSSTPAASRHARFLSRMALLALETAREAVTAAGLPSGERLGVFAAVGGLRVEWAELVPVLSGQRDDGAGAWARGLERMHPFWMLKHLSNNAHALLAADLGARGDGATFGGATAGAQAIASATRALAAGTIDAAVVVAYDSLLAPEALADLGARGALAVGAAAAPYDESACGLVPAEAAAALVLASDGDALAWVTASSGADGEAGEPRHDTIARVAGRSWHARGAGHHVVVDGAARARPAEDAGERRALATLVSPDAALVATAGATGALGAATALVQTIVLGTMLRRGVLAPIAGLSRPAAGPLRPLSAPEAVAGRAALCISTGAPGLASAVLVEPAS